MTTTIDIALYVCIIIRSEEISVQKETSSSHYKRIPDNVWNEVKHILPKEKPCNTKGHPAAVLFRKVLDGILLVLRTGCQLK
jgi:hypothetical protein